MLRRTVSRDKDGDRRLSRQRGARSARGVITLPAGDPAHAVVVVCLDIGDKVATVHLAALIPHILKQGTSRQGVVDPAFPALPPLAINIPVAIQRVESLEE